MKPLILRSEEPPDDAIVVVRGGEMKSTFVRETARDSFEEFGFYSISVFLAVDVPVDELCASEPRLARYGKVRVSTAGRLRRRGFVLLPTLDRPHFDVLLPDLSDEALERLDESFDPPIVNPGRGREVP